MMEAVGFCDNADLSILVESSQPLVEQQDTLLHEVLHAIAYQGGLTLPPAAEEKVVRLLATGLIATFADNPQFYAYLKPNGQA